jgi:4-hydroxy-2-oxoglutarate aldolase
LQHQILSLNAAVTTKYGVAGLKFVMDRIGLYGGPVRPPLLPLSPADQEVLLKLSW